MSTVYQSAAARRPELPAVPENVELTFQPGEWGWNTTTPATVRIARVRTDLRNKSDDFDFKETGDCWVWVAGQVDAGEDLPRTPKGWPWVMPWPPQKAGTRVRLSALRRALAQPAEES